LTEEVEENKMEKDNVVKNRREEKRGERRQIRQNFPSFFLSIYHFRISIRETNLSKYTKLFPVAFG
jgi:hypothetical protein